MNYNYGVESYTAENIAVRSVRTNELQRGYRPRLPDIEAVRSMRTNELQLSRTGVRRPLPRVCSVRTNELQRVFWV